jgi:RNA polymerase sigma factor for flagellar operon FliA
MDHEVRHRVESNVALVEHIVTRMSARFPAHVERDDLVQAGMLALVETAGRYDADRGVAFSTFAGRRIEGAILDVIRHGDWLPRSLRAKSRELNNVEAALLTKTGSTPDHRTVAEAADMSIKELSDLRSKVRRGVVMALDRPIGVGDGTSTLGDTIADFDAEEPLAALENRELKAYIRSAIHLLPPRHRAVLVGYFLEERPMDELGALLGVTQSRISQIKDDALRRIREGLDGQYDEAPAEPSGRRRDKSRQEYAKAIADDSTTQGRLQPVVAPLL